MAFAAPLAGGLSLGSALSVGSAVIGGISSIAQSRYQARVLANNAAIEEANAERAIYEANITAQDKDLAARGELGALIAQQGASGLDLGSGSLAATRAGQEELAAQDRGRIVSGGQVEAEAARSRAADFRAQSSQAKRAGVFSLLETGLSVGTSLVGSSSTTRKSGNRVRPRSRPLQPAAI